MDGELIKKINDLAHNHADEIIELRRYLHRNPELGFAEKKTAELVAAELGELGLEVKTGVAQTGVVGLLRGELEGPTILLRADMDALPIQDKKEVDYASRVEGVMHACGHDAHTAILLGAARILSGVRKNLRGNVKFVFQPAEEGPGGAAPMIEEGVMENPLVNAAFALHVDSSYPPGEIGLGTGPINANADEINVTIKGKGGHGARPHTGVDALTICGQAIVAMQQIVSRMTDPCEDVVLTFGKIEGGYRRNVIPEKVRMEGTLRTRSDEIREEMYRLLDQVLKGVTSAFGGSYCLNITPSYPALFNDGEMADLLEDAVIELGEGFRVNRDLVPSMGGEDFAYFSRMVPSVLFRLGTGSDERTTCSAHGSLFDIDEKAIPVGMKILAAAACNYLEGELDGKNRNKGEEPGADFSSGQGDCEKPQGK